MAYVTAATWIGSISVLLWGTLALLTKLSGGEIPEFQVSGVNYLVRSATTMMAGWVVLLFTLSSLLKLLLSSVAFPL